MWHIIMYRANLPTAGSTVELEETTAATISLMIGGGLDEDVVENMAFVEGVLVGDFVEDAAVDANVVAEVLSNCCLLFGDAWQSTNWTHLRLAMVFAGE